jgi:hypothetical protein
MMATANSSRFGGNRPRTHPLTCLNLDSRQVHKTAAGSGYLSPIAQMSELRYRQGGAP